MNLRLKDYIDEAINHAVFAFGEIAQQKEDVYSAIYDEYNLTEEQEDKLGYYVEGLFDFAAVGGMVVSPPGSPDLEDLIDFLERK